MHIDAQTERLTYRQADGNKKVKILKTNTAVVDAGPPDTEYLYCPLDIDGITLKGTLLPALI